MIKGMSHVCFSTADLEGTIAFYNKILGGRVIHEFKNDAGNVYGVFIAIGDSPCVEFFRSDSPAKPSNELFRHFCLEVDDIEKLVKDLSNKGIHAEVRRGRTDQTLQCWIEDPNGIKIEFQQYDQQSRILQNLTKLS